MLGLVQGREQWRANTPAPSPKSSGRPGLNGCLPACPAPLKGEQHRWRSLRAMVERLGTAIRIGDAAVARDALASQGIANGISAGLSLFEGLDPERTYCRRTRTEILSHLTTSSN